MVIPSKKESLLRRIDVRVRLISLLLLLPIAAFTAHGFMLLLLGVVTGGLIAASNVGLKTFLVKVKFYFILSTASLLLVSLAFGQGDTLTRLGEGAFLSAQFNILVSLGVLYALTTNPNEIPQALSKMRVPHRFGILIMIGFRLYPLIMQRMQAILQTANARGLDISLKPISKQFWKNTARVFPTLLLSTLEVGVRLGETMMVRGYDPTHPITISPEIRMKAGDWLLLLASISLLVIVIGARS
jgi:energy-coupling factor transport system permease protein